MVSSVGAGWHTIYSSLAELDIKLEELGLVEVNGEIVLLQDEESRDV